MCGSVSVESVNCGSCGTTVLSTGKRVHVSAFKPMCVTKGQLSLVKTEMKTDLVIHTCRIMHVYVKCSY